MAIVRGDGELTVQIEDGVDGWEIVVVGEIDMATSSTLRAYIDGVIVLERGDIVLDLSGVGFMDSTGLGVIVKAARDLEAKGFELVLRAPSPRVRRVLQITGIGRLIRVQAPL